MQYLKVISAGMRKWKKYHLITWFLLVFGFQACNDNTDPRSPQTRQECLDKAYFGNPEDSPFCLPFAVDSSYLLTQSYCSPFPGSHEKRFCYDFQMPFGTEVLAARAGEVVELREHFSDADSQGGHENMVCLRHDDATLSLYIHMMRNGVDVEMGDYVERGALLGWIGTSGTGFAHLHFQICERSGMCTYPDREFTIPMNFSNSVGKLDERGGLIAGEFYLATTCDK
jgi:hypothetical protein